MSPNEQLNALFARWEASNPGYKGRFVKDGIINDTLYKNQRIKLLFISKEPNDLTQQAWDFREWWKQEIKYRFAHRIYQWAFGVLNDFPPLEKSDSNQDKLSTLGSIAFMNLKKVAGGASADPVEISAAVSSDRACILDEIRIINPDIIIGGLGATDIWRSLFDGIEFTRCYDILIARHGNHKIIDFYHPSYRAPRAMSYSLLQNIVQSVEFQQI